MSSTITQSETQMVPKATLRPKFTKKPKPELLRTTSIEKIKKFNTYICSQNYYILPSLLVWLKTSQTVLQCTTEKTLFYFKTLLLSSVLYKDLEAKAKTKALQKKVSTKEILQIVVVGVRDRIKVVCDDIKNKFFSLVVYFALMFILVQLLACAYSLCIVFLPVGLIFLLVCLYSICHIMYKVNFSYLQRAENKRRESRKPRTTRPSRSKKPILGDRTISNFNLF